MIDGETAQLPRVVVLEAQVAQLKTTQARMVAEQAAQAWRDAEASLKAIFSQILADAGVPSPDAGEWALDFETGILSPRHPDKIRDLVQPVEQRNGDSQE